MAVGSPSVLAAGAILAAASLGGCAAAPADVPNGPIPPMNPDLQALTRRALADAATLAHAGASAPVLVSAERVTWPDGSLGCPRPGMAYTMALVPGYRIRIRSGAAILDYHAGLRGSLTLCPPERATEPVTDSRV